MSAGLPGFGLSGVFFVLSALLMLPIELAATLRRRSSLARWGRVLRNAGLALAILAGTELTYAAVRLGLTQLSGPGARAHGGSAQPADPAAASVVHGIPVLPILGTLGLVAFVLVAAKTAELLSSLRPRASRSRTAPVDPRSRRGPVRPHRSSGDRPAALARR